MPYMTDIPVADEPQEPVLPPAFPITVEPAAEWPGPRQLRMWAVEQVVPKSTGVVSLVALQRTDEVIAAASKLEAYVTGGPGA